jgi:hypothetical protein
MASLDSGHLALDFFRDSIIKPELRNIRMLDFYRYQEILSGVEKEVDQFRERLGKNLF